jgi:mono/diheme cytochrome c family protein
MNRYKKTFSFSLKNFGIIARIITGACFVVSVITFSRSLAQPPAPIVHAYTSESKKSGATLFHERGCEHCHGIDGRGGELGPDLSTVGKRLKNQQIEQQIRKGGAAMPAFGDVLQPDEIKDLVDFLHAKRKAPKHSASLVGASSPAAKQ